MSGTFKNMLLFLGTQIPLAAVFFTWWSDISQNPVVAFVIAVLYEAAAVALAFGKKVWEQELEAEAIKATGDWVKTTLVNFSPGFRRRYKTQIIYSHRFFKTSGLRTKGGKILEVEDVFIQLRVAHSDLQTARFNPVAMKELASNQPIWAFLRQLDKQAANALAIIGPPGSGKTTLLQHIALTLAANKQRRYRMRAFIPLLLFLREHTKTIIEKQPSLADLAQKHYANPKAYPHLKPPANWFARQLDRGKCLVLLDGLDEVSQGDQRRRVSEWVDVQIRTYHHCQFILTARPQGYRDAPLEQAHVLEIQPFNPEQVAGFIQNWYLASKMIETGKSDAGVRQDAGREAQDLLRRLQEKPTLNELAINPLLLTMIALVHNHRGVLPGSRVELYAEICDVFLGHWQRAKKLEDSLDAAQKRVVLQPLAASMMSHPGEAEADRRTISTEEALRIIKPYLEQVGLPDNDHSSFLKKIEFGSGLLLETEVGQWSFAHKTFQEYLCATHWQQSGETPPHWRPLVADPWWQETLLPANGRRND